MNLIILVSAPLGEIGWHLCPCVENILFLIKLRNIPDLTWKCRWDRHQTHRPNFAACWQMKKNAFNLKKFLRGHDLWKCGFFELISVRTESLESWELSHPLSCFLSCSCCLSSWPQRATPVSWNHLMELNSLKNCRGELLPSLWNRTPIQMKVIIKWRLNLSLNLDWTTLELPQLHIQHYGTIHITMR